MDTIIKYTFQSALNGDAAMCDTYSKIVKNVRVINSHSDVESSEDGYLITMLDEFNHPTNQFYWVSREDGLYYVDLIMNKHSDSPYWEDGTIRIYGINGTCEVFEYLPDVLAYCGR